ncbi:hypothetical protein POL68_22680 [Stigmatella sp. ncwal1]|uniref:Fido domain-containing protein n=1 Tax=Stigmatella ashevillensis TaxID=2995309 RepID=A0ABT5DCE4_9BACT|nr:hypothetical protein [Stigmatella ashevillena]MDC0711293.1 hypothetical protein [Stigmatella ashevillena]
MLALKNAALAKVIEEAQRMEVASGNLSPSLRKALSLASQEVLSFLRPSSEQMIERAGILLAESNRLLSRVPVRAVPPPRPVHGLAALEAKPDVEVPQTKAGNPALPPAGPAVALAHGLLSDQKHPVRPAQGGGRQMSGVSLAHLIAFNKKLYDLEGAPGDKKKKPYTGELQDTVQEVAFERSLSLLTEKMVSEANAAGHMPRIVEHRRIVAETAASLASHIVNGQVFIGGNHRTGCWSIYKLCALNSCWLNVEVIMLYGYIERLSAEKAGKKRPPPHLSKKAYGQMMRDGKGLSAQDSKAPVASAEEVKPFTQALSNFLIGRVYFTPAAHQATVAAKLADAEAQLIALPVLLPEHIAFFRRHSDSNEAKKFLELHWKTFKKLNDE